MALIDNTPRMATAIAVRETTLILITQATFQEKLKKTDPFIRALLNIFVRNIRNLTQQVAK
jgi:CRP-like cAMP-binding protein